VRTRFLIKAIWIGVVVSIMLFSGCTTKKSTSPTDTGPFMLREYFPLSQGDEWIWEIVKDSVPELFVDGDINLGEPFIDTNYNGIHDFGEDYEDLNSNGKYDGPNDPWSPGIPFIDRNNNGLYEPSNGKWDEGELIIDPDSLDSGPWPRPARGLLKATLDGGTWISSDGSVVVGRRSRFLGPGGFFVDRYTDDGFSNDSLGLRWHSHTTGWIFAPEDDLKDCGPIAIARASIQIGDSVINADTSDTSGIYIWISVFEGVENVTTPAGSFRNCLKFKSVASGWTGNMQGFNGTSYQWYAKNVGLVKSEGPSKSDYWLLKSASINGTDYP